MNSSRAFWRPSGVLVPPVDRLCAGVEAQVSRRHRRGFVSCTLRTVQCGHDRHVVSGPLADDRRRTGKHNDCHSYRLGAHGREQGLARLQHLLPVGVAYRARGVQHENNVILVGLGSCDGLDEAQTDITLSVDNTDGQSRKAIAGV